MASIDIQTVLPGIGVAPAAAWFEAVRISGFDAPAGPVPDAIYERDFHEITYIWTFGDPGTFTTMLNMPTFWNNRDVAYGRKVPHIFDAPGTYSVTLFAVEMASGKKATQTINVTIADPETTFAGNRTILVDPAGAGDAVTYPAATVVPSIAAAVAARKAIKNLPARVLLKRGETFTVNGDFDDFIFWKQSYNFRVGAWGSGARPVLEAAPDTTMIREKSSGSMSEFVVHDLDFKGGWDSTTESGTHDYPFRFSMALGHSDGMLYCIHRCSFDGFLSVLTPFYNGASSLTAYVIFSDMKITNWRDYGAYCYGMDDGTSRLAFVGCSIAQHGDALNGGEKNGFYNTHGALRFSGTQNVYVGACDLFSRCGWSAAAPDTGDNAALRANTRAYEGHEIILDRICVEGLIEFQDANGNPNRACNIVIDKLVHIGGSRIYNTLLNIEYGGTTLRNYYGLLLDVPPYHPASPSRFVNLSPNGSDGVNNGSPVEIYNATFLDLRSPPNDDGRAFEAVRDQTRHFTDLTVENVLNHAPDMTTPIVLEAPIDVATALPGVSPRYKGVRFNFAINTLVLTADVPNGGSVAIPYSDITDRLYGGESSSPTDQAYWQAIEAIDTEHVVSAAGSFWRAAQGEIAVAFEAAGARVTNLSGETWSGGSTINVRLDRTSLIPPMLTEFSSTVKIVPLPRPGVGSPARDSGGAGLAAYDDLLGDIRPTGGNERGALLEG